MTQKRLYRITRADGGTTVTPKRPDGSGYTQLTRLIADDGKMLTLNGTEFCPVVDTDDTEGWYEVELSESDGEEVL